MQRNNLAVKQEPPRERTSLLASVQTGIITGSSRIVMHGPEGVGKSTFASEAPAPIFLDVEQGTRQLDVSRYPQPTEWTWEYLINAVDDLIHEQHNYQTLVFDTLDKIEELVWADVCRVGGKQSIEDFAYGKGYAAALDTWRSLFARLDTLRASKGMHVIALAHSTIKTFKNPEGDDFDRYEFKLHQKAAGLWKERTDAVLFARYEELARKVNDNKVRAVSTGARIIHTTRTAALDAKNRYSLPETLPLDWKAFWTAVQKSEPENPEKLRIKITQLLEEVDADTKAKVSESLTKVGNNSSQLVRIINKLSAQAICNC